MILARTFIFFFACFISLSPVYSQTDSTKTGGVKNKKAVYSAARKATIMSALLPGLGQVYNKKYWKAPVIYAGLGGLGYFFYTNNNQYNNYRSALIESVNNGSIPVVVGDRAYNTSQLQTQKLYYRKFRDFAGIGIALLYVLNIIDANVDAHLKTFDVSDDLSINVDPWQGYKAAGVSVKFNFK